MGLHNNSLVNLERAVLERVFFCKDFGAVFHPPPLPVSNARFTTELSEFTRRLHRRLPVTTLDSVEGFLNHYKGRKRAIYAEAAVSLQACGIRRRDSYVNPFVKAEKINFSAKPDSVPRVIQPRDPRYNLEVGRYIKNMEKPLYRAIDKVYGTRTVTKGLDNVQTAELIVDAWKSFVDPRALKADAKRFDQHVHETALRWEHGVYLRAAEHNERTRLGKLLSWQINNRCFGRTTDGKVVYETSGKRMSGDMNTAMGNVAIMCGLCWSWIRRCGIKVRLINNGDDCVFIMESWDVANFTRGLRQWFLDMGFALDVGQPVAVIEQIEFCQSQPVWNGERWNLVRAPNPAIGKDTTSILQLQSTGAYFGWMKSVGIGGEHLAGDMPIYSALYESYQKAGKDYRELVDPTQFSGFDQLAMLAREHGNASKFAPPSDEARVSFWLAFDVTPYEQEVIEQLIRNICFTYSPKDCRNYLPGTPEYLHGTVHYPGIGYN